MGEDILQVVSENEIPKILEIMKKDWPKHFLLHQYLTVMEEYKKAKIQDPHQVLYRYGSVEDGFYLLQITYMCNGDSFTNFFMYTASSDLTDAAKALMETTRIPWSNKRFVFEVNLNIFTPFIQQAFPFEETRIAVKRNALLWLPPEDKFEVGDLPEGVYLDALDLSHVPEINKDWYPRFPGSEKYLEKQIINNFGLGLYTISDSKLVCSAMCFHSYGISVLQTDPQFRGKGYAETVVRHMVKEIRLRGKIPFGMILLENIPSQNLFRKIGFKEFTKANYIAFH